MTPKPRPRPTANRFAAALRALSAITTASLLAMALPAQAESPGQAPTSHDAAQAPLSADMGGPRRWVVAPAGLTVQSQPSSNAPPVAALAKGTLLANHGCHTVDGDVWCEVRPTPRGARGFAIKAALAPARGPDGRVPMGPDDSARRAGKGDFDARGRIACAQEEGEPLGDCTVGVARSGGGDATAIVTFANGFSRALYFTHGAFVSANATMSGNGTDTDWRKAGGIHRIRVEDQRYELSDGLILGP